MGVDAMRAWCATYQWPSKEEFRVGTVWVRENGTLQEVEAEANTAFEKLWGKILPNDVVRPNLKNLIPGILIFIDEKAAT